MELYLPLESVRGSRTLNGQMEVTSGRYHPLVCKSRLLPGEHLFLQRWKDPPEQSISCLVSDEKSYQVFLLRQILCLTIAVPQDPTGHKPWHHNCLTCHNSWDREIAQLVCAL